MANRRGLSIPLKRRRSYTTANDRNNLGKAAKKKGYFPQKYSNSLFFGMAQCYSLVPLNLLVRCVVLFEIIKII